MPSTVAALADNKRITPQGAAWVPAVMDDIGLEFAEAVRHVGHISLDNANVLNRQLRIRQLNKKEWWSPPINFSNAKPGTIAYIHVPGRNQLVPIRAKNAADLDNKVEMELKAILDGGEKFAKRVDPQTFEKFHELRDQAFEGMTDMSDSLRLSGASKGTSALRTLDIGDQVGDIADSLTKQFNSVSRRMRGVYFEPQIQHVKALMRLRGLKPGARSIYSDWLTAVYGGSNFWRDSNLGKLYNTIEEVYDETMGEVFNRVKEFGRNKAAWLERKDAATSKTLFVDLQKEFGGYTPFADAADFLERTAPGSTPVSLKKQAAALNGFTSTMTLRLFEAGHAILNMLGMAATTPAVLRALNRLPEESKDEWITRIGAFGSTVDDIPVFSPTKLMTNAAQWTFTNEGKAAINKAKELGYFKQQVSEIIETIIRPHESLTTAKLRRVTDRLSLLSDKSEEFARALAHMQGYYLAKQAHKMESETVAHAYAHKFANDVIGDYNPANKPQMFQGAVGMPIGLFQTYMWNYFSRVFSYVENKQFGALATQYAMQAAVFGGQSVPGFAQFNEFFAANQEGSVNPADNLRKAYGPDVADFILHGGLTHLTQMGFNMRGDGNVRRVPNLLNIADTPGLSMVGDMMNIVNETVRMFRSGGQYSNQQMMEIIGTHFTNRPLRNLAEVAAGVSVDKRGQLIAEDTRTGLAIAARMLGAHPVIENKTRETNYKLKSTQVSRRSKRDRLRDHLRPKMRTGNYTTEDITDAFITYIETGGSPDNFGSFLKDMQISATVGEATLKFQELLNSKAMTNDLARFMNMGLLDLTDDELK